MAGDEADLVAEAKAVGGALDAEAAVLVGGALVAGGGFVADEWGPESKASALRPASTIARSCVGGLITVALIPRLSTGLAADAGDGLGRVDNRDAGMAAKDEQIVITGDDQIGLRCDRESQHRAVRGIAADRCWQRWRVDDLSQPLQPVEHLLGIGVGAGQDLLKLRTVHDLRKFD